MCVFVRERESNDCCDDIKDFDDIKDIKDFEDLLGTWELVFTEMVKSVRESNFEGMGDGESKSQDLES